MKNVIIFIKFNIAPFFTNITLLHGNDVKMAEILAPPDKKKIQLRNNQFNDNNKPWMFGKKKLERQLVLKLKPQGFIAGKLLIVVKS